ncbi:CocE/NonD family hydrolase [Paraburkholderia sp. MPAMCS5]|uniref:CocE/NonD family hydrolase n=1 Tax=Paraburkholderia sp. MPAMCS5 TaxID=3112563 RepID=UPI002E186E66|nr:CocE/NonD family hydrolase [Paraburkholderia sp. MPAMCS5]
MKRSSRAALLAAAAILLSGAAVPALASTPFPGGVWSPGNPTYGTALDKSVPVTMSDGTVLMVDVSYPTDLHTGARAKGPFPVILTQTPYLGNPSTAGDYFVQRGYIYVTASVRGTRNSGGEFSFFGNDGTDGAEIVRWAATKLQNSNGKIALQGGSWSGLNQYTTALAAGKNSPIKALAPFCAGAEFYRETYFAGGIPTQTGQFPLGFGAAVGNNHGATAYGQAMVDEINAGGPRAYYRDFWKLRSPGTFARQLADLDIPTLIWSTHQDIYAESSMSMYAYLQNARSGQYVYGPMRPNQEVTGRYQVIISQGGHCQFEEQTTGQNITNNITLEWFDTWLKGKKTGMADTKQPVHVHELISNNWISTSAYPVAPVYKQYFLTPKGALSKKPSNQSAEVDLLWAQPGAGSTAQFDGPVLKKGATLAGPMSASFYASSTTPNLELIATVQLVGPDGSVTPLSSGTVLGSLSKNDPNRSWLDKNGVPVKPYGEYFADHYVPAGSIRRYDFVISPRFASIPEGSKVRLIVSTQTPTQQSNGIGSPPPANSQCSPVLGTDACFPTHPQAVSLTGSTVSLYVGASLPSSLNLPLLKAGCFKSEGNTSLPYWDSDSAKKEGPVCQEADDD